MRHKSLGFVLIACLTIVATEEASAWDGLRKGFVLGIGGGLGRISFSNQSQMAVMSDFKLGYAPNSKLAIFWTSKVAWFKTDFGFRRESTLAISTIGAVAVAYYLKPEGDPAPYLTVGYGFSSFATPTEEGSQAVTGDGIAIGAGYEFSKHWSVEGNLTMGAFDATAFRITLNVLGY